MLEEIKLTKAHASGNDFIFILENLFLNENQILRICDRNFGIGCDQLLIFRKQITIDNSRHLYFDVYNSDSSMAGMCGNAMRCIVGLFLNENEHIFVNISDNLVKLSRENNFAWVQMPEIKIEKDFINIGNLHKVFVIDDLNIVDKNSSSEYNKSYVKILKNDEIFIATIERGAGETYACGSGICASVYYCRVNNLISSNKIKIHTKGTEKSEFYGKSDEIFIEINKNQTTLIGNWNIVARDIKFLI